MAVPAVIIYHIYHFFMEGSGEALSVSLLLDLAVLTVLVLSMVVGWNQGKLKCYRSLRMIFMFVFHIKQVCGCYNF